MIGTGGNLVSDDLQFAQLPLMAFANVVSLAKGPCWSLYSYGNGVCVVTRFLALLVENTQLYYIPYICSFDFDLDTLLTVAQTSKLSTPIADLIKKLLCIVLL